MLPVTGALIWLGQVPLYFYAAHMGLTTILRVLPAISITGTVGVLCVLAFLRLRKTEQVGPKFDFSWEERDPQPENAKNVHKPLVFPHVVQFAVAKQRAIHTKPQTICSTPAFPNEAAKYEDTRHMCESNE
jgi:hypothetical protein